MPTSRADRPGRRRGGRGGPPRPVLRQPPGRSPRPADPAADRRRRPAGVRRGRLPPVRRRPHHRAGRLLAGVVLPVLLGQGGRVPPPGRPGGAPDGRVDRGARPAHPRRRRLAVDPGLGGPLLRGVRAVRAGVPGVPDRGRERRGGGGRLGPHERAAGRRLPVPADRRHPAAPPARPGDRARCSSACPAPSTWPACCGRPRRTPTRPSGSRTRWPTSCTARCSASRAVNVHPPAGRRPPVLGFSPLMRDALDGDGRHARADPGGAAHPPGADGRRARAVRGPRLPRHPHQRRRGRGRPVPRGLLPLLRVQGGVRPDPGRAGHPHRVRPRWSTSPRARPTA